MIRLLLGGTRSGKSALGEALLLAGPAPHRVIATGRALDFAFRERIQPSLASGKNAGSVLAVVPSERIGEVQRRNDMGLHEARLRILPKRFQRCYFCAGHSMDG